MKKLSILITVTFSIIVLNSCGGGGSDTASVAPTKPTSTSEGKLVIDNGRGTTNNQDTERVK